MVTPMQSGRSLPALPRLVLRAAEGLFPGYFALVMATGVVSIACHLLSVPGLGYVLVAVNWIAYVALWALTLLRLVAGIDTLDRARDHAREMHRQAPLLRTICRFARRSIPVIPAIRRGETARVSPRLCG